MIMPTIWALMMNSEQARIMRGLHPDRHVNPATIEMHTTHKDLRDIMADKPGRVFSSADGSRSGMEYHSDPVKDAQRHFVQSVVNTLERHRQQGDFDQLAVFASRDALGMLRDCMPPALAKTVIVQEDKNFLHQTVHELEPIMKKAIFPRPVL